MEENKNKNDIVQDAYYLISLFEKANKTPTQLHIQKLMFLFETAKYSALFFAGKCIKSE